MSLNMGNLTVEVNTMKNILVMGERRRQCYKRNQIRRDTSKKGYKHNVEIQRKNRAEVEQKNKVFIKKL